MVQATTTTSDEKEKQEKKVEVEFFHIDMIPDAMDKMGWKVGPKVMRHWFSITPAFAFDETSKNEALNLDATLLPVEQVNTDIIKMSWAMQYKQVSDEIKRLAVEWCSVNGKALLKRRIGRAGSYEENIVRIGYTDDVKVLDSTAQVNLRKVGSELDTIDDWYGAMGKSNLKVCVRGYTSIDRDKHVFIVEQIGFYLKDTYDFVDESLMPEPLGVWSKDRVLSKSDMILYLDSYLPGYYGWLVKNFNGFVPVFNSDFRKWQHKHNSGGDFIIFSDVMWMPPAEKDRVIIL